MDAPKRRSVFQRIGRRRSVFDRIGLPANHRAEVYVPVCKFWVQGRCNRNPCRFRHSEDDSRPAVVFKKPDGPKRKRCSYDDVYDDMKPQVKRLNVADSELKPEKGDISTDTKEEKKEGGNDNDNAGEPKQEGGNNNDSVAEPKQEAGDDDLQDHIEEAKPKAPTEVASPPAEQPELTEEEEPLTDEAKTVTESTEEGLHCSGRNGDCLEFVQWAKEIRPLLNEGRWLFVAMDDSVNAFNMDTNEHLVLAGLNAPIRSMAAGAVDKLVCGPQDGSACGWKGTELVQYVCGKMVQYVCGKMVQYVFVKMVQYVFGL